MRWLLAVVWVAFDAGGEILMLVFPFEQIDEVEIFLNELLFFVAGRTCFFVVLLMIHIIINYQSVKKS